MIGVKHIISVARNEGLLVVNPFAGYMISPEQVDRGFLSEEELQLLMKAPMKNKSYELVRDLFVFAAFTGLAYSDIKNLTKNNLQTFLDGHLWIITRRQKNKCRFEYTTIGCTQTNNCKNMKVRPGMIVYLPFQVTGHVIIY